MKVESFFSSKPNLVSQKALEIWSNISKMQVFGEISHVHNQEFPLLPQKVSRALNATKLNPNVLPIQTFKLEPNLIEPSLVSETFLSSGTSSVQRSQSHFSPDGLELYKYCSLATFFEVLNETVGSYRNCPGISLIPNRETWPQSSLAQMLEWISSYCPVKDTLNSVKTWKQAGWIFGTGFHFVDLYDRGVRLELPEGSHVIETGGTKGKSRYVDQQTLHSMIQEIFSIKPEQIISEYGMCELACQAYEYHGAQNSTRSFKFPSWVNIQVADENNLLRDSGHGCLVVHDYSRIDVPWPIQTQDIATFNDSNSFKLNGRVPGSPLKGCSLNVEDVLSHQGLVSKNSSENHLFLPNKERQTDFEKNLRRFISSPYFKEALNQEFSSPKITDWAIQDLLEDQPNNEEWIQAINRACTSNTTSKKWLLIPPQTHSIALIYPLALATLLGIDISVRRRHKEHRSDKVIYDFFKSQGLNLSLVHDSFKITKSCTEWGSILVYGSDETITDLSAISPVPINGFGSIITASIESIDSLEKNTSSFQKDFLSLDQLGCLSTRLLCVISDLNNLDFKESISNIYDLNSLPYINHDFRIGTSHELFRYNLAGEDIRKNKDGSLFIWHTFDQSKSLNEYLGESQFCCGVMQITSKQLKTFKKWLKGNKNIRIVSSINEFNSAQVTGQANQSPWTAPHNKSAVFDLDLKED